MKKKEITIQGVTYPVTCDMQTLLNYEEIVKHSFFKTDWTSPRITERMALIYAAVLSADDNATLKFEDLKGQGSWNDIEQLITAFSVVSLLMTEYFPVPDIEQQNAPEPSDEQDTDDEDKPKN